MAHQTRKFIWCCVSLMVVVLIGGTAFAPVSPQPRAAITPISFWYLPYIHGRQPNSWLPAANMIGNRTGHTATLLPSGQVLVAGGRGDWGGIGTPPMVRADLYDPVSNTWSEAATMNSPHNSPTATLLPSGNVLMIGQGVVSLAAELYNPVTNRWWTMATMHTARESHTATLLPSGKVLVAGGGDNNGPLASAEL
jgi:hypothetical protein